MQSDVIGSATKTWFRQLRRLQSYAAAAAAAKQTPEAIAYRLELWTCIRRSPGFDGSFPAWWRNKRALTAPGAPALLPTSPPTALIGRIIFDVFRQFYERFKAWHLRQPCKLLRAKYDKGMAAIYHDLKKPQPDKLDFLHSSAEYSVLAFDETQRIVHLDRPVHGCRCHIKVDLGWTEFRGHDC